MNEGSCLVCSTSSPQLLDLNLNEYILRLQFIEDETKEHSKQLVHDHSLVKEQTHLNTDSLTPLLILLIIVWLDIFNKIVLWLLELRK